MPEEDTPADRVRNAMLGLGSVANLGHRGMGPTRLGHPFPENSLSSFSAAMDKGAHGIELDARLTRDGKVVVIHDGTLDRTTDIQGCVSSMTLREIQACRLLDGDGQLTDESPPTLQDAYRAIGAGSLINIELKTDGASSGATDAAPDLLVKSVLGDVMRLGEQTRTIFSSFDEAVVELLKAVQPGFYCALVSDAPSAALVERAVELRQDAIHLDVTVTAEIVQAALESGLQVTVWNANTAGEMQAQIDKGVTGIITNEPGVLTALRSMTP